MMWPFRSRPTPVVTATKRGVAEMHARNYVGEIVNRALDGLCLCGCDGVYELTIRVEDAVDGAMRHHLATIEDKR